MRTAAAILEGPGRDWEVTEVELDPPREREVLVRFHASGICHSDEHVRTGDLVPRFPLVGGHEGAGVVEAVGPGTTRVEVGAHVVCSSVPACGHCRFCATGQQNLCDMGMTILTGCLPDGTYRFHRDGEDLGGMCMLGTFAQRAVVSECSCVSIDPDLPLDVAALVGCGVLTGWGSAVHASGIGPGDTVVVYGIGGVGISAVQGARHAGASNVVAVDPLPRKRERAEELGATHSAADGERAQRLVTMLTLGVGADVAIVAASTVDEHLVQSAVDVVRKGGTVTLVGLGGPGRTIRLVADHLTLYQKRIQGALFGSASPTHDIRRLLELYRQGTLKLDELVTGRYPLDQINTGFRDLTEGRNLRGIVVHEC